MSVNSFTSAIPFSNPKKQAYENLADTLIEKFNLRGIEGYYVDNKGEALIGTHKIKICHHCFGIDFSLFFFCLCCKTIK